MLTALMREPDDPRVQNAVAERLLAYAAKCHEEANDNLREPGARVARQSEPELQDS